MFNSIYRLGSKPCSSRDNIGHPHGSELSIKVGQSNFHVHSAPVTVNVSLVNLQKENEK